MVMGLNLLVEGGSRASRSLSKFFAIGLSKYVKLFHNGALALLIRFWQFAICWVGCGLLTVAALKKKEFFFLMVIHKCSIE